MASRQETDVAVILEQLRTALRAVRNAHDQAEAETSLAVIERELHHCAEQLEITRVVSAHWPLEGRSLYERMWVVINKVVRRALRWYINPIVEQQNAFNEAAARSLRLLIEAHADLRDQLAALQRRAWPEADPAVPHDGGGQQPTDPSVTTPDPSWQARVAQHSCAINELQPLIQRQSHTEPPAPLPDLALRPCPRAVHDRTAVQAHWLLTGTNPPTQARALVQRGVRQYLRWLINPIVEQQNGANAALSAALGPLLAADGELRARLANLRARR